ncbi:MAG TPA: hypothetical protein VGA67_04280 [Candidatus Dojkabacteria bacterium]
MKDEAIIQKLKRLERPKTNKEFKESLKERLLTIREVGTANTQSNERMFGKPFLFGLMSIIVVSLVGLSIVMNDNGSPSSQNENQLSIFTSNKGEDLIIGESKVASTQYNFEDLNASITVPEDLELINENFDPSEGDWPILQNEKYKLAVVNLTEETKSNISKDSVIEENDIFTISQINYDESIEEIVDLGFEELYFVDYQDSNTALFVSTKDSNFSTTNNEKNNVNEDAAFFEEQEGDGFLSAIAQTALIQKPYKGWIQNDIENLRLSLKVDNSWTIEKDLDITILKNNDQETVLKIVNETIKEEDLADLEIEFNIFEKNYYGASVLELFKDDELSEILVKNNSELLRIIIEECPEECNISMNLEEIKLIIGSINFFEANEIGESFILYLNEDSLEENEERLKGMFNGNEFIINVEDSNGENRKNNLTQNGATFTYEFFSNSEKLSIDIDAEVDFEKLVADRD